MRERFIKGMGVVSAVGMFLTPANEPQLNYNSQIQRGNIYEVFAPQGTPKNTKLPERTVFVLGKEYTRKKAGCLPFPSQRFRERKRFLNNIHRRVSR